MRLGTEELSEASGHRQRQRRASGPEGQGEARPRPLGVALAPQVLAHTGGGGGRCGAQAWHGAAGEVAEVSSLVAGSLCPALWT